MPLFFPQLFLFYLRPTRKFGHHQPGCDPATSWREVRRGQNLGRRQKADGEEREQERARRPGWRRTWGKRKRRKRIKRTLFSAHFQYNRNSGRERAGERNGENRRCVICYVLYVMCVMCVCEVMCDLCNDVRYVWASALCISL